MARCGQCGSELPDYYTSCPNCGSTAINKGAAAGPAPVGYIPPAATREVTTVGGWFGWTMLMSVLPIIGAVITMKASKDPTAQNYAKLMIILQAISLVLQIVLRTVLIPALEELANELNTTGLFAVLTSMI